MPFEIDEDCLPEYNYSPVLGSKENQECKNSVNVTRKQLIEVQEINHQRTHDNAKSENFMFENKILERKVDIKRAEDIIKMYSEKDIGILDDLKAAANRNVTTRLVYNIAMQQLRIMELLGRSE